MDAESLKQPFRATLEASLAGLQQLRLTLEEEHRALLGSQPEALEQIVRHKAQVLEQLEHSVTAREQMQRQLGLPAGLAGAEQFVQAHFSPAELLQTWQALVTHSREVGELNIRNGKLAMAGERTTREALGILTGRGQSTTTYSRAGQADSGLSAYSLGKC
jgi:flagellar biosynthesis/type III secretory pathway chaperone